MTFSFSGMAGLGYGADPNTQFAGFDGPQSNECLFGGTGCTNAPAAPVRLVSQSLCTAVQCGVGDESLGFDCSQAGFVGNHTCGDPICAPFEAEMRAKGICPTAFSAPQVNAGPVQFPIRTVASAPPAAPATTTNGPAIAPMNVPSIVSSPGTPSIVNSEVAAPSHGDCDNGFAKWVDDNKLMAVVGLFAAAYFIKGAK